MPKISIIIPFNNGKKYLKKCLDSVTSTNYDNYEIILIDDFSKDNSEEISKKYKNVKYFYTTEETIGVGNARNLGVEKSNGKYIMFLDVDDTIEKDLFKKLENYMNQDIDMIKYKMKIIKDKEFYADGPIFEVTDGEDAFNKLCFKDNYLDSPCLYLIKKELPERTNLYFEKNVYHEDFGLIPLLLANAKTVVSTDVYGYNYYQSENSIMRNEDYKKQIKKVNDKLFLYEQLKKIIVGMNLEQNTIDNLLVYYTNSIILAIKCLKKEDRIFFERKIKEKGLLKNLRVKNLRQMMKKLLLELNMELYFKVNE